MNVEEMKKEIRTYCFDLIINSKFQDWDMYQRYIKDNIIISMSNYGSDSNYFDVHIYKDNTLKNEKSSIIFTKKIKFWSNKEDKKENKLIKSKYSEIKKYFDDKNEYDNAVEIYNLLPIKVLRKNKLKIINENEEHK